ncbi:MAG TPA: DMT family transporter [Chloroflexia bacterium]|nr:DMT family transporter [Chloroflexia bacterium]
MRTDEEGTTKEAGGRASSRGVLLVLISAATFGGLPVFAKLAYAEGVNLKTLLALRFTIAAVVMWLIWAYQRSQSRGERATTRWARILPLIVMGTIGYVGQSFAYFTAVDIISITATSLLLYTYPALVALLAWLFYREPFTVQKFGALVLAGAGTMMVLGIFSALFTVGGNALGELRPAGVAWALAAAVIYSGYIIAGAKYTSTISPIFSSAIIISSAAVVYLTWGALSGELQLQVSLPGLVWATGLALVSTVVAIATFFAGLRYVGPSRAAIISTLEPTVSVLLAALVFQEMITLEQLLGGGLILVAVVVLQLGRKRNVMRED